VAVGIKNEGCVFMVALPKEVYAKQILFIKEKIAEIICIYYKPLFIVSSLKNFDLKNSENIVLLDILASYDFKEDIDSIVQNLSLCGTLYLASFVNFKLFGQIAKWKDIGALINQNSLFLMDSTVKLELMRFLISGITSRNEIVKITTKENAILIFDKDMNSIDCAKIFYAQNEYDNSLFELICRAPKKIEVFNPKEFDVHFLNRLYEIFGERVVLREQISNPV
jgi:hypothetical protein